MKVRPGHKLSRSIGTSVLLAVFALSVRAGSRNGTSGGQFLRFPAGARMAALGEGGVALARDASALHWNPAGLIRIKGLSVVMTHAGVLEAGAFDHIAAARPASPNLVLGLGVHHFTTGQLSILDAGGAVTGDFQPRDLALSAGAAWTGAGAAWGAAAKFVRSRLLDSAGALTADVGALSPPLLWRTVTLAAAASNLGGALRYEGEASPLPVTLRAGASAQLTSDWSAALDAVYPRDRDPFFTFGVEGRFPALAGAAVRGGYNGRAAAGGASGLRMGFGLSRGSWGIDYAFLPEAGGVETHWFSLTYQRVSVGKGGYLSPEDPS